MACIPSQRRCYLEEICDYCAVALYVPQRFRYLKPFLDEYNLRKAFSYILKHVLVIFHITKVNNLVYKFNQKKLSANHRKSAIFRVYRKKYFRKLYKQNA